MTNEEAIAEIRKIVGEEVMRLRLEVERLQSILENYGMHRAWCATRRPSPKRWSVVCDCGWDPTPVNPMD